MFSGMVFTITPRDSAALTQGVVGVMFRGAENNLITEVAIPFFERPTDFMGETGHVWPEDDFSGIRCSKKGSRDLLAFIHQGVAFLAGRKESTAIRVRVQHIVGHRLGDGSGHLRTSRPVRKMAVFSPIFLVRPGNWERISSS